MVGVGDATFTDANIEPGPSGVQTHFRQGGRGSPGAILRRNVNQPVAVDRVLK
eukprot:CAMPEP_0119482794 /NCGR_PEP_ID=MMETSP1344-20130328/10496_1 /TAXON_ID=236787 /ORGANISM="Florenciella parvula, Strain CCMP2471" /LENGTH=52 /DNA_ID=CAMNT_0007517237 /DNA_START=383 /DNA_END=539 /DNA_ORIENTATION=+